MRIATKTIKDFPWGTIDTLEDRSLPDGAASRSLNWITLVDKIELRRGYAVLGNTISGTGKVTGLYVAKRRDGTEIAFRTRGKKLEYLKTSNDTWTEIGTNVLGNDADGKDISFAEYHGLAGDQLFVNSPYGPFLKIMLANPDSYATMYDSTLNYKGYIRIKQNRMFLWGRLNDKTSLYLSFIDDILGRLTAVADENVGTGNGVLKTFTDTLAFKAGGAKRTCFGITVTDTVEAFVDNHDGTLTGDAGGTGTINYMSGAISLTFAAAVGNGTAILADYSWEDSTDDGVCDFGYSAPTRVAGEGDVIFQNDGGNLMDILSFGADEYCIHESKIWILTLGIDDTTYTNYIYREKTGMPTFRAGISTKNGIYFIDDTDEKDPQGRVVTIDLETAEKLVLSISQGIRYKKKLVGINLADYSFNKAVTFEWGNYIVFVFRQTTSSENDRLLLYDKNKKTLDIQDYWASCLAIYGGTLIGGDPFTNNVYTMFSGTDDDEAIIPNYWEGNLDDLGWEGLQAVKELELQGEIGPEQTIRVSAYIDNCPLVFIGDIESNGSYVDRGRPALVGPHTIGSREIGGGGTGVSAYNYRLRLKFSQDKFDITKLRFEAIGIGYASISRYQYFDIRIKSKKLPSKYR